MTCNCLGSPEAHQRSDELKVKFVGMQTWLLQWSACGPTHDFKAIQSAEITNVRRRSSYIKLSDSAQS